MSEKPEWADLRTWTRAEEKAAGYVAHAVEWRPQGKPLPELVSTAIAADLSRYVLFETFVLTIIKAVQSYLPPDSGVSKDQFISEVLGAVDNPAVFAALHGTSDAGNDSLKRALERGR